MNLASVAGSPVLASKVDDVVSAMHDHEFGRDACVIGRVVDQHPGIVVARTRFGATRVVDLPLGEQLPRIC